MYRRARRAARSRLPAAAEAERIGARACGCCCWARRDRAVDAPDAPGVRHPDGTGGARAAVRPDARDTLEYFAEQQVSVKVISGDNAVSVGAVAGSLGLHGETLDARKLPDRPGGAGRHPGGVHHLRPGAARPEADHGARPAVARAHRRDDRRRRQRRAGAQGCRHRCGDGLGQRRRHVRWPRSCCWTTSSPRCRTWWARAAG